MTAASDLILSAATTQALADQVVAQLNQSIDAEIAKSTEVARLSQLETELKATIAAKNATIVAQDAEIARLKALIPAPPVPPVPVRPAVPAGWKVSAEDWFDKPTLDPTNWTAKVGPLGAPRQEYCMAKNVRTGKGLDIDHIREAAPNGYGWTSGYISSSGLKMTWDMAQDVRVEAFGVKFPDLWDNAAGIWTAPIWVRCGGSGEIDLWEAYGWPFAAARTGTEALEQRGNGSGTIHNDTMGGPARTVRQPKNVPGGFWPTGSVHNMALEITSVGVLWELDGKPLLDGYGPRPNPVTWAQLAANAKGAINRSSFSGRGHIRIQTQIGSPYWGLSDANTKNGTMHIDGVRVLVRA